MKNFLIRAFAVLMLLAFIAGGVFLTFFADFGAEPADRRGQGDVSAVGFRVIIFVIMVAFPLLLLLWILFPKPFNKLIYKGLNSGIRNGAGMLKYKERCEEQNVPNITVNGVNLPAVMAASDMIRDGIKGEDIPELAEPEGVPHICEQCGTVLDHAAGFCTSCGTERSS